MLIGRSLLEEIHTHILCVTKHVNLLTRTARARRLSMLDRSSSYALHVRRAPTDPYLPAGRPMGTCC